jgi:phage host-nuclease inhibitor protein Gam
MMVGMGGCQEEQQATTNIKSARLMAAENRELQQEAKILEGKIKDLQAEKIKQDDEIKNLKSQLKTEKAKRAEEVQGLSKRLDECKAITDEKLAEEAKKNSDELTTSLMNWITELSTENERLKAELAEPNKSQK